MGCCKKLVWDLPGLGEALSGFRSDLCENRPVGDGSYVPMISVVVCFIWRETVNSELARTRGIRLSN